MTDINHALQEIVIDLNQFKLCDGLVNFTDGINPLKSRLISSISTYFKTSNETISISKENHISVFSLQNATNLIVNIQLLPPKNESAQNLPYFISRSYPYLRSSLTGKQTLLFLEGSMSDINLALQEIIINLNKFEYCDGLVNFTDGVNPPKSLFIPSISKHFKTNNETILFKGNRLTVSSLSSDHLIVSIQLDRSPFQAYFVAKSYPYLRVTITNEKTLMFLEGSVNDINIALQEVLVDLGSLKSCGGLVTVLDNINPPYSQQIEMLSDSFYHNEKPRYNSQISN